MTLIRAAVAGSALTAAGLFLAGCGDQPAATPAATGPTEAAQVTPQPTNVLDVLFLRTVRDPQRPDLAYSTDAQLISAAHNMCTNFAAGSTARQILATSTGTQDDLGWVMGVGISAYCPQYKNLMMSTL